LSKHGRLYLQNFTDSSGGLVLSECIMLIAVLSGMSATQLGLLNAFESLAVVVVAVPASFAVDRAGPFLTLPIASFVKVAIAIVAALAVASSGISGVGAGVLLVCLSATTVLSEISQTTAARRIEPDGDSFGRVVASMAAVDRVVSTIAPAVVGVLVGAGHEFFAIAAALALLSFAAIFTALLRQSSSEVVPPSSDLPQVARSRARRFIREGSLGFVTLWRSKRLRAVVGLLAATNGGLGVADTVMVLFILRRLGLPPATYGLLASVAAASAVGAALLAPLILAKLNPIKLLVFMSVAQFVFSCLPLAVLSSEEAAIPLLVLHDVGWSASITLLGIAASVVVGREVPQAVVGRATGASRVLTYGVVPIASMLGGIAADRLGIVAPLVLWSALSFAGMFLYLLGESCRRSSYYDGVTSGTGTSSPEEKVS